MVKQWIYGMALITLLIGTMGCVTERTEATQQQQDGREYLHSEVARIVARLSLKNGRELYMDLGRLVAFGDFSVEPMMDCLKSDDAKMRSSAAFVLGQLKHQNALDELMELTTDENKLVRFEAARAVLEIGAWDSIPVLFDGLEDDEAYVRYLCIQTLSAKTGETFGYVFDGEPESRSRAIKAWKIWWEMRHGRKAESERLTARNDS